MLQVVELGQTNGSEQLRFTDVETARMLRASVATARRWRFMGTGPRFGKFDEAVHCFRREIEAFIAGAPSGGGGEEASIR